MSIKNKNKIKAVIFDWGGVCCSEGEPFASKAFQNKVGKHPNDICKDVMGLYLDFYRGKYTPDEFYRKILRYYNFEETALLNPETMTRAYIDSTEIWHDVLEMAKKLQNKYKVSLLSDLTPVMRDYIHKVADIVYYFPIEMYSCDEGVGMVKGDGPAIFKLMLERMGVAAPDALFIDNSKNKIKIADGIGLQTMLFENRNQFFRDIKQFL
ncbi:MAG: HAD family hydrolase [Candidatus Firestonebacteria bacterium]